MIISTIQEMSKRRDIINASQLAREAQLHPAVAYKLWGGDFARVDCETLDRLCNALKCLPGQLLRYKPTSGQSKGKR